MKALLIIMLLPTANTSTNISPETVAVEVASVEACEAYSAGITALHADIGDPRGLIVKCLPEKQ
ncbi:hypothetical protein ACFOMH_18660 [Paracoccus mangrovi]|uniref:Uncharacterized protein n=1 Tax=Paracoccus mangrovi TaxID=1715645 RepID=A0ABV7R7L1_9RHOB